MEVRMSADLFELYRTGKSRRYKDVAHNQVLLKGFIYAVETMKSVASTEQLGAFSRLHYEKLKYKYRGFSSVRLSNAYIHRLIFRECEGAIVVELIEIDDTHYGNK